MRVRRPLQWAVGEEGSDLVLRIRGEVDMSNVHDLVQALRTVLSAERSTLIDLSALEYIDSRGLSVLEEYSGVFPVKLRPSPLVMRLLQVLKIADRFQIVEGAARK